jgi:hypothetical protein
MSEGIKIDFSALKDHDYVGSYVNAFKVGQALGKWGGGLRTRRGETLSLMRPRTERIHCERTLPG